MSLRSKIVLILSIVVVAYAALDNTIQRVMVRHSFTDLERSEALEDLARARKSIEGEVDELSKRCLDWARWDDSYRFVREKNEEFVRSNLDERALEDLGLNLLYFCAADDLRVVWGRIEETGTREPIGLRDFPAGGLAPTHKLIKRSENLIDRAEGEEHPAGLLGTEHGPMLVSMCPITDSSGESETAGWLIMGRFLDETLVDEIGARIGVEFAMWSLDKGELPAREREMVEELTAATGPVLKPIDDEHLLVYATLPDVVEAPEIIIGADIDRAITVKGARAVNYALLSTLATAFLILFVLLRLLQRIVIDPIAKLTRHAVDVGRCDDMSVRLDMKREDEIGQLSAEFDEMMEKLATSRSQLAKTARMAGMSEIATGVLHNVGNVLNSVNVSANLVTRKANELQFSDLEMMHGILREHEDDLGEFVTNDPRGKHLLPFIGELVDSLGAQKREILEEVTALDKGIEHIIKLVRSQQAYAGAKGVYEPTQIVDLVNEAFQISTQSYGWTEDIQVHRDFESLPKLMVERHKLMEILVNLIQNARQAMNESKRTDKRLELAVRRSGPDSVVIEVSDNGIGIPEENLARIFNHGFTTRADGHGFGLHISANAATEMKGTLHAYSDGLGSGARFALEIPVEEPALAAAA